MMWFKNSKPKATPPNTAPSREPHVSQYLETKIATFLVQKGRLALSLEKQHLHFTGMRQNNDGSVDYTIRASTNISQVRIGEDGDLKLLA